MRLSLCGNNIKVIKMKKINLVASVVMLFNLVTNADCQERKDSLLFPELPKPIVETMELYQNLCYSNVVLKKECDEKSNKIQSLEVKIKDLDEKIIRLNKDLARYSNKDKIESEFKRKSDSIIMLLANVNQLLSTIQTNKQNEASLLMQERTKGRQDVKMEIEQFYSLNSFDEIADNTTINLIKLHKKLLFPIERESVKLILDELEIYFSVKEKLKTKCSEMDFVKFQGDLNKINSKSDKVSVLKLIVEEGPGDLNRMYKMLTELNKYNQTRVANDANTTIQKRAMLYEKIDYYCFDIGYRNLNWPYLDGYLNELKKRVSQDSNIQIDDIIQEFK
jgi:hypothetical protein